ncbi:MAG: flagellar biosynthesis protein FliQ [Gammaproteobacteria bacterium]|nr:flagellar biosynthesis protein FliQ [Gammaproteobacteria bacterium]MDH5800637.1 flagellar biosynthesis protein FliQ [Gammaproteobacteria bacterium]
MTGDFVLALTSETLWAALLICAPVLGLSMLVGVLVSLIQVVTQIQEMSLTFIPKLITVGVVLVVFGPWMLSVLLNFSKTLIGNIPQYL